jgi:proton-dependent oligopeptide transporter, POT family
MSALPFIWMVWIAEPLTLIHFFLAALWLSITTAVNIGALLGITCLPILAQHHVTAAYMLPVAMLSVGIVIFVWGTPHYVQNRPRGDVCSTLLRSTTRTKGTAGGATTIPLTTILRISLLIVPFCIAYSQMPTTFIVQGTVMEKAFGVIDAATMNSLDAVSVLLFGYVTASHVYPALAQRGIKIPTTYKFAMGSFLGALSILWALYVESMIHRAHAQHHGSRQISVLWQAPSYILIGFGEIFAVSAAYEVAFVASSPQTKALASAINIFCVGGIPNILCIALYQACEGWFRNSRGDTNIQHVDDYVTAHVAKYFWVLVGILIFGIILNTLTTVRSFVESVEKTAADIVKTPLITHRRPTDEETPLLLGKKFGQPVLYKMGSMRAGPTLSHTNDDEAAKHKHNVKYSYIHRLYQGLGGTPSAKAKNRVQQQQQKPSVFHYDRNESL